MTLLRKYVAPILFVVFCWYYSGIQLGLHTHIIDGKVVSHSHPGNLKGHSHTSSQIAAIDLLTNFQSDAPTSFHASEVILSYGVEIDHISPESRPIGGYHHSNNLRGPPQDILS